ncbi:hypothetical protein F2Q69_00021830 [Brassica cretica]|uniref:Uncharacterized protein n=1 Tax=Brassica cretica TaxID=69181 RepID=A0A8S9Q5P7_BRACR|nr:hypothetical protein F2Q69_00021830 [Brassica cretica]
MGRNRPKPTTRIRAREEIAEVAEITEQEAEIAELPRGSRNQLTIKEGGETRKRTRGKP